MEVGTVPGVRADSLLSSRRPVSAQPPAFEIEPTARSEDETYSASHQAPDRGLADEDSVTNDNAPPEQETPSDPGDQSTRINIFA
jgi:hypothetical protein